MERGNPALSRFLPHYKRNPYYAAKFDLPELAHAVLVSATIPHGSIKSIDQKAARAVPGVLDILTHESEGTELRPVKASPRGPAGTSVLPLSL